MLPTSITACQSVSCPFTTASLIKDFFLLLGCNDPDCVLSVTRDSPPILSHNSALHATARHLILVIAGVTRSTVGSWQLVFGQRTDPVLRLACSWRVTTMWVNRPLQVSQLGQLSLPSFRGRYMSSNTIICCVLWWRHLVSDCEVKSWTWLDLLARLGAVCLAAYPLRAKPGCSCPSWRAVRCMHVVGYACWLNGLS